MAERRRLLQPNHLQIAADSLWVADWFLPVVARIPLEENGRGVEKFAWPVDKGRPELGLLGAIDAMAQSIRGLWLASSWAGSILRLPDSLPGTQLVTVPFGSKVRDLVAVDDACWAYQLVGPNGTEERQLWLIEGGAARLIDLRGEPYSIAALDGELYATMRRRTDGENGASYSLNRVSRDGTAETLFDLGTEPVELENSDGVLWGRLSTPHQRELWRLDIAAARVASHVVLKLPGALVAVGPRTAWFQSAVWGHYAWWNARFALTSVPLPILDEDVVLDEGSTHRHELEGRPVTVAKRSGELWVLRQHSSREPTSDADVVALSSEVATIARVVTLPQVDISSYLPEPKARPDFDPIKFANEWRDNLLRARLGPKVVIEEVELLRSYPDTHLAVLFRAESRPGVLFGRRQRVFTEAGLPHPELQLFDVHLTEDLQAVGYGLPLPGERHADKRGIVWV